MNRRWWAIESNSAVRAVFCTRARAEQEARVGGAHGRKRAITREDAVAITGGVYGQAVRDELARRATGAA